jgi:hypothetical protein
VDHPLNRYLLPDDVTVHISIRCNAGSLRGASADELVLGKSVRAIALAKVLRWDDKKRK